MSLVLDEFQKSAFRSIDQSHSVLVAAPTGAGKTLVAEHAIERCLSKKQRVFYTSPLKALSNQKFVDFSNEYGAESVGLLTGDNAIRGDANIVVMTTEVLRNMLYAKSVSLSGLGYVVFDEVHYLQDQFRGAVWEEALIHLSADVGVVCLSATVSNAEEFGGWLQSIRGTTDVIIEENRPIPLTHWYAVGDRARGSVDIFPTFANNKPNPEVVRLLSRSARIKGRRSRPFFTPSPAEMVEIFDQQNYLPAVGFIFSRAGCEQAVEQCVSARMRFTNASERAAIRQIAEESVTTLTDNDLDALDYDWWLAALEDGIAAHHAGLVPPMKEAVEQGFVRGLVKVVFATETLALGINMPAKGVFIEKTTKFNGEQHESLTPGEYTQLAGRAGRRGIDTEGHVAVCWSPWVGFDHVASLASRRTFGIKSSFKPSYNMAANLISQHSESEAVLILRKSFGQYQQDVRGEAMTKTLVQKTQELADVTATETPEVKDYRDLVEKLAVSSGEFRAATLNALRQGRLGDVFDTQSRFGRVALIGHRHSNRELRLLVISETGESLRIGPDDFDTVPEPIGEVEIPQPYRPRNAAFRRVIADQIMAIEAPKVSSQVEEHVTLRNLVEAHPGATTAKASEEAYLKHRALKLEIDRLSRRVAHRDQGLTEQFFNVVSVLSEYGYVDDWTLTEKGKTLAKTYNELDLILVESLFHHALDLPTPAELAGALSAFTFVSRGDEPVAFQWPSGKVAESVRSAEKLLKPLNSVEREFGVAQTRGLDPGICELVFAWVNGDQLADILELGEELTGGDFVREMRMLVDLLRQVGDIAPNEELRCMAKHAAKIANRGVISATSVV